MDSIFVNSIKSEPSEPAILKITSEEIRNDFDDEEICAVVKPFFEFDNVNKIKCEPAVDYTLELPENNDTVDKKCNIFDKSEKISPRKRNEEVKGVKRKLSNDKESLLEFCREETLKRTIKKRKKLQKESKAGVKSLISRNVKDSKSNKNENYEKQIAERDSNGISTQTTKSSYDPIETKRKLEGSIEKKLRKSAPKMLRNKSKIGKKDIKECNLKRSKNSVNLMKNRNLRNQTAFSPKQEIGITTNIENSSSPHITETSSKKDTLNLLPIRNCDLKKSKQFELFEKSNIKSTKSTRNRKITNYLGKANDNNSKKIQKVEQETYLDENSTDDDGRLQKLRKNEAQKLENSSKIKGKSVTTITNKRQAKTENIQGSPSVSAQSSHLELQKSSSGFPHGTNVSQILDKFQCETCGKSFKNKCRLYSHTQVHLPKIKCKICHKLIKGYIMKRHMKYHREERPFKCDLCPSSFFNIRYLRNHMYQHMSIKKFYCDVCGRGYNDRRHLLEHKLGHTNPSAYKCDMCPKGYERKQALEAHMQAFHMKTSKVYECKLCGFKTKQVSILYGHSKRHNKTIACDTCDKKFSNNSDLMDHKLAVHVKEKNVECKICGKFFVTKRYMLKHIRRTHVEVKKFKCEICEALFKCVDALKQHFKKHKTAMIECEICKRNVKEAYLKKHQQQNSKCREKLKSRNEMRSESDNESDS